MKKYSVAYIVFNDSWDGAVQNRVDQAGRPARLEPPVARYLDYLARSIRSLLDCHSVDDFDLVVTLVEISRSGLTAEGLTAELAARGIRVPMQIHIIGYPVVLPFLDEARRIPETYYRSPNRMHEFLLFHVIGRGRTGRLALVDPDVVFLRSGCLNLVFDQLDSNPEAWIAGFLERGRMMPWGNGQVVMRERLHSVALFVDRTRFVAPCIDGPDWRKPYSTLVSGIPNTEARTYYATYQKYDTFNMLTEYLKYHWGPSHLLVLNDHVDFYEGSMLTILSSILLHAKYLDPAAYPALQEAIAKAPSSLREAPGVKATAALACQTYQSALPADPSRPIPGS